MKKPRILEKCIILSFIISLFSSIAGVATATDISHNAKTEITKNTKIAIYQFYYNPFGYRCNISKEYISDFLTTNKKFKNIPFQIINIQDKAPEELVPNYTSAHKAVVIINLATKEFTVSKIRELIGLNWTKDQIQKVLEKEIKSVM